jgi:polygalacturonase
VYFQAQSINHFRIHKKKTGENEMQLYNIVEYGAVQDGTTLATGAIAAAIEAASNAGGGTVVVPSGTYLTGAIFLKNNIELHVSPGAILSFSRIQMGRRSAGSACVMHLWTES